MERTRILIVDDKADHQVLLAAALKESSPEHWIGAASDAQEALTMLSAEPFDAILCDYNLPGCTGLDVLKTLRDNGQDLPFLLLTGHGSEELARQAFLAGATDYVTKEAVFRNPADLSRKLRRALERRRLENEKQKAEAILESFLENNPYSILIFSPEGRILRWNRTVAHMPGRSGDLEALVSAYNPLTDEQLRESGTADRIEQALAGRWVELPPFEWDPNKAGFSGIPRVFRGVAFPIPVTGENAPHLCAMIQDVTEEETARRERNEYAAVLSRLLDATDTAIFFVSADLRVRFLSRRAAEFFGIRGERHIGSPVAQLIDELAGHAREPEAFAARSRKLYDDLTLEAEDDVELSVPERRLLRRKSGPVRDGKGVLLGRIEVYDDQTEAVDRRILLEDQNRELDAFASRLAHDLKTPIVSLKGFADLLYRHHASTLDPRGALYLEKIQTSAGILGEMVDGIRALVDASRQVENCGSLDPLPVLRMVTEALGSEASERGVEVSLPAAISRVKCDRAKLFQMFQNLLSNAIRHCDEDKPVRWVLVEAADRGSEVEVRVSDNGVGLDSDEIIEIFQPFRRGRGAAGRPGMGLGLAISQRVAQTCGGRIEARSKRGEGSSFSLFLPRTE